MAISPVVSIQHLNHAYGTGNLRKPILLDINLVLNPGEIVILRGPSGSGKTTLLTLIGALRSLQDGYLSILGYDLRGVSKQQLIKIRQQIGFIFQLHHLLDCLTLQENVGIALKLHPHIPLPERRVRSVNILAEVGLGEYVNYYPRSLSGGQKQRAAIARALVTNPKLVLADEPTASLDSHNGREVVRLIQHFATDKGCAVLLVTHDNRILDVADRIVYMEDGRLSE
jgi:putative ABC transport system ATP-binding protein